MRLEQIETLRAVMSSLEENVFSHQEKFLKQFAISAWDLAEISFYSEGIRFTYVQDSGQHVADYIDWKSFENWLEGI